MAAKRYLEDSNDDDGHIEKKIRNNINFTSCVRQVLNMNSWMQLCGALEPMFRRVVNEEVCNALGRHNYPLTRSPSLRSSERSCLKLVFTKNLALPIFTGNKLLDIDGNSLQIMLVCSTGDSMNLPSGIPSAMKVEIMAINGDFPPNERQSWTREEFEKGIVKERNGRRPLLAGDSLTITLRDGTAVLGDIECTDNSSWIRSRKFRIGARVIPNSCHGFAILEAISEPFVVKDHRGELYKKHYPPMLNDEVWRLEKVGKDGAFHKKLKENQIESVQDFLKLHTVYPQKLRSILGNGMSDKMWEAVVKHATTCDLGKKNYILNGSDYTAYVNPICQIVRANINGNLCLNEDLSRFFYKSDLLRMARDAYNNWGSLEEASEANGSEIMQGNNLIANNGVLQNMATAMTGSRTFINELEGSHGLENVIFQPFPQQYPEVTTWHNTQCFEGMMNPR